jgi:hypothetical protein
VVWGGMSGLAISHVVCAGVPQIPDHLATQKGL